MLRVIFDIYVFGFAFHLAAFARSVWLQNARGMHRDVDPRTLSYMVFGLFTIALAWPAFIAAYFVTYARRSL